MSEMGHSRHSEAGPIASNLPPSTDILRDRWDVAEVPMRDMSKNLLVILGGRRSTHAEVLELRRTGGTSCFRQRLFPARLVGLIFIQAMEQS